MRYYSSTATPKSLSTAINTVVTQMTVNNTTGLPIPSFPFTLVIDPDGASEEIVSVTASAGNVLTIARAQDGSSAFEHLAGAVVKHMVTARDLQEPQNHMNTGIAVHGIAGSVVGTSDTQTLTNKSISGSSNTLSNIPQSAVTSLTTDISTINASLATKAPLASPALTGNPTATTQTQGDNSTKLATTAYVDTAAAAKASLASPTFTGIPAAPTATADTNTTQVATTAFVVGQASSTTPVAIGTAAVGTSLKYARADHVHAAAPTIAVHLSSSIGTGTTTSGVYYVIPYATELFDITNIHNTATNPDRVTPTVAGYYYVSLKTNFFNASVTDYCNIIISKNGTDIAASEVGQNLTASTKTGSLATDAIVYCNGTTDYINTKVKVGVAATTSISNITLIVTYVGA